MFEIKQTSQFVRRTLALSAILGASVAVMGAQSPAAPAASRLNLDVPVTASQAYSSSTDNDAAPANDQLASVTPHVNFANAMQYGGRQSYGRPRYRGSNSNADGSNKWDFYGGGGFNMPIGTQTNYLATGWGLQVGGGRMFNARFGTNLEFDYDHFGMTQSTLNNQQNLYNNQILNFNNYCSNFPTDPNCVAAGGTVSPISGLGGTSHIMSLAIEPIYNIRSGAGMGAYVIGGFGFYHKVADFTEPAVGEYCDYIYGCYEYQANQIIDHYTSNAPGVNVGMGFTYKFSRFSSEKLYGEVRYVYMFDSARTGVNASTCTTPSCAATNDSIANDFPQNSNRTSYLPVKFGIRF